MILWFLGGFTCAALLALAWADDRGDGSRGSPGRAVPSAALARPRPHEPVWQGHAQDPDHWRDTHYRIQQRVFAADKRRSRRVTLEAWRTRPRSERVRERLAVLLRGQL